MYIISSSVVKFPKFQYERILKIVKARGLPLDEFYFVKRKGWIRIEYLPASSYFTYFKKKETSLNDSGQWEFDVYFKVKTSEGIIKDQPTFDSLMMVFEKWVKELN